ncbi:MAG: BamA/TamA family outer membrane protein [Candidatus Marinimicrobia bacterium]|jgi:outer membrane protein insertion porin family|nr:BamA/TamA family outer membrane protein [Candidatus Neomarinimicrobiota bacterium]MBT4067441.1 BamA/TamA family outer membrane protein [Candidatus Neomarinimicrobiota bacterium]MBT4270893.1 BamA/TamA family outer membrane protein [Candidatus Neomarinimicrobiota bacterium]MBT4371344.1 BamA/TamA family outer membrane protein [Candidatus Neomarinimicrobiota bacterium]MBT4808850.1 BamA/TamA family outer membrane protein [Candidatus Neomarinimicrobiota bacterium]
MRKIILCLATAVATLPLSAQQEEIVLVNTINFIDNNSFNQRALREQIELKPLSVLKFAQIEFDRRLLKLDAISIKNFYNSNGFLEATVKDSFSVNEDKADIYFIINEGNRYYLNSVEIIGLKTLKEKKVISLLGLKEGSPYNPVQINTNLAMAYEAFQEVGKLFAQIDIQQEIKDSVNLTIKINEGADVFIHESWVSGTELIDSSYVRREFAFKKGDLFRKSLMDKTKRTLLQAGFFSSASLITHPVISEVDSLINIEVRMKEFQNRGVQDIDFGYEDIEYVPGVNSMVGMGGSVQWSDRMIFGSKNRFDARGSVVMPTEEGFVYPRFSIDIKISNQRPFSLKLPTQVKVFYQQFKNFGDEEGPYVRRIGLQYSNIFRWNRQRSFLDVGIRLERFDESDEFKDNIEQRKFSLHLHQDNRDNPVYPTKGNVIVFKMDAFGGWLGGNRSYSKYDLDYRQYISPLEKVTIAGRINAGLITAWTEAYDQYETVLFEKFYLGGSNTLRAWKPLQFMTYKSEGGVTLPLGMTAKVLSNLEIRFPLFWRLGGVLFYDGGYISDSIESVQWKDLQWNRGIGITIDLPIGPIRIDYAESEEDPTINQIHLGFLYSF